MFDILVLLKERPVLIQTFILKCKSTFSLLHYLVNIFFEKCHVPNSNFEMFILRAIVLKKLLTKI